MKERAQLITKGRGEDPLWGEKQRPESLAKGAERLAESGSLGDQAFKGKNAPPIALALVGKRPRKKGWKSQGRERQRDEKGPGGSF